MHVYFNLYSYFYIFPVKYIHFLLCLENIFLCRDYVIIQCHLFFVFWCNYLLKSLLKISFLLLVALSALGFSLNSLVIFRDIPRFLFLILPLNFLLLFPGILSLAHLSFMTCTGWMILSIAMHSFITYTKTSQLCIFYLDIYSMFPNYNL